MQQKCSLHALRSHFRPDTVTCNQQAIFMCDTLVVQLPPHKGGGCLLAKNSDREPDEAQELLYVPRRQHGGAEVACTYRTVPQVAETAAVLLSKPFQMWGAEMGVNEHGVAIGNEAVFTNVRINRNGKGLTGMDLLRLALERSTTAQAAVHCITDLLQQYGQDACGGYRNRNFFYHNSFLVADPYAAYVLETAGRSWAVRKVTGAASISNALSIATDADAEHRVPEPRTWQALFRSRKPGFCHQFSDVVYTRAGRAHLRRACTLAAVQGHPNPDVFALMQALRQHERPDAQFNPAKATTASICMHATGFTNPSSTTSSMVAHLRANGPNTVWLTGTPHPCLSVYLPFYFGPQQWNNLLCPGATPDDSLWWQAQRGQHFVLKNYTVLQPPLRRRLDALQQEWIQEDAALVQRGAVAEECIAFSQRCLAQYRAWWEQLQKELRRP